MPQKPVKKPGAVRGCESCNHRGSDFVNDTVDQEIIRCYCSARHVDVNAETMSKDCDFWEMNPEYIQPKEQDNKFGL